MLAIAADVCRLLARATATTGFLVLASLLSVGAARALDEAYCKTYAEIAVIQSAEHRTLNCSGGLGEWWSEVIDYHKNWCRSQPEGSSKPDQGTKDRAAVLALCRAPVVLVVHNNTDATLEVYVAGVLDSRITTPTYTLPPVSVVRIPMEFGRTELVATAINVEGQPRVVRPASVYKRGTYVFEFFPADFGTTFMSD